MKTQAIQLGTISISYGRTHECCKAAHGWTPKILLRPATEPSKAKFKPIWAVFDLDEQMHFERFQPFLEPRVEHQSACKTPLVVFFGGETLSSCLQTLRDKTM